MLAAALNGSHNAESERLIQQNESQLARVRDKLARAGGELKPQRRAARAAVDSPNFWKIPGLNRDVRVDIKVAPTDFADEAARGIARALESCGFSAKVMKESDSLWEGVHVESRSEQAAAALLIQGAFRTAGLGAGLTIHDRAAAKRIVVHVGARGLW
jgi:hypothetical protein